MLELECRGAVLLARLDGRLAATAWAPSLPSGRIGLHGANLVGAAFDEVRVDFPLPPEPVLTTHEVFSHELSMGVWAGAATDWEARWTIPVSAPATYKVGVEEGQFPEP